MNFNKKWKAKLYIVWLRIKNKIKHRGITHEDYSINYTIPEKLYNVVQIVWTKEMESEVINEIQKGFSKMKKEIQEESPKWSKIEDGNDGAISWTDFYDSNGKVFRIYNMVPKPATPNANIPDENINDKSLSSDPDINYLQKSLFNAITKDNKEN